MKYNFNHSLCSDFCIYEINKLRGRSFFVPFSSKKACLDTPFYKTLEESDLITLLDGEWDFAYFPSKNSVDSIDTARYDFDKVNVPSMWQTTGYEAPWYLNTRYQFECNPPHIPDDFSYSVYRKIVTYDKLSGRKILTFLGLASALSLYINGKFVGYSEGSHNMHEFDISAYLTEGENEIVAVVYKWCNGTYLECQDMFRHNGIFRSVYITNYNESNIYDIDVKTIKVDKGYDLSVTLSGDMLEDKDISIELLDKDKVVASGSIKNNKLTFNVANPKLWSAETPNLYKLVLSHNIDDNTANYIAITVGFKTVKIKKDIFYFNDKPIKLLGVNHHDSNPKTSFVMSYENMLEDILLMKDFNVNCVRTSHYPPHPFLIELCNIHGLYVVDEADIEAHGCYTGIKKRSKRISNNLDWVSHYTDRVVRLYLRDKNNVSIIMWSLGNEAGGYKCQDACYDRLKALTDIPIHYEHVVHHKRFAYDVISEMYQRSYNVEKIGEKKFKRKYRGKPYYMCEYAHAMGVGPGSLNDYVETFLKYENIMGGCIWEWVDHAMYRYTDRYEYTYGGDHNEPISDGNFCVDGLFSPDRKPHTGAYLMKHCYRPLRASLEKDGLYIENIRRFTDSSDIAISYTVTNNESLVSGGNIDIALPPMKKSKVNISYDSSLKDNIHINFKYIRKSDGHIIANEQIAIKEAIIAPTIDAALNAEVKFTDNTDCVVADFNNIRITFNKAIGYIDSILVNDKECLYLDDTQYGKGVMENIWRAVNDNERNVVKFWKLFGYDNLIYSNITTEINADCLTTTKTAGNSKLNLFKFITSYKFNTDGSILINATVIPLNKAMYKKIPKFGFILPLIEDYSKIEYYGRGDMENFSDFKAHTSVGLYNTKEVLEYEEPHIKPQDSGNRSEVRYVKALNGEGHGFIIQALDNYLNFNVSRYPLENLYTALHREDLFIAPATYMFIDGFVRGLGSNSCGQDPLEEHELYIDKPLQFSFKLTII